MEGDSEPDAFHCDESTAKVICGRYPFYDVKPIPWKPPAAYFQPKREIEVEPEPEPVPVKASTRKVNKELLSEDQKEMYGKTLFEKDLVLIRDKEERLKALRRKEGPIGKETKPPSIYFREEKERRRKMEEERERQEQQISRKIRREKRMKAKAERDQQRMHSLAMMRREEKKGREAAEHAMRMEELAERARKATEINIELGRPTRASALKSECARRINEGVKVEERRERLNEELRREQLRKTSERIQSVVDEINPVEDTNRMLETKRQELKRNERQWRQWLKLTEQTNKMRETMLERLFYGSDEVTPRRLNT